MNEPGSIITISERTFSGSLPSYHIQRIARHLLNHGLVLLPSDSCYSLAALAVSRDMYRNINLLLNRNDLPISIAFPNYKKAEEYANLHVMAACLLQQFTPGLITVVCRASSRMPKQFTEEVVRSNDGTVGVRIPDSIVEREVANCTQFPITTVAVRDEEDNIVQNFEQAVDIVKRGMARLRAPIPWMAIEGAAFATEHSTVVRVNENAGRVDLLRPGAISFSAIQDALKNIPV